ncbi:hypothetical protein [Denitrobaculum tricleocarpae]|uniref:Nuclear transport factor 2 family protein n=1 Tax=Denitrobaculum tricleocarpae TaxID=2591009 RepID=A0A545TKH3_9PROT|nr:hypothetical protein [Denitrobaculum tricleocarpae]TQV77730.1 hypothetical protein FKG95_19390 [Denitrobaculum tricleocarpae]
MKLRTACLLALSLFVATPAAANDAELETLARDYFASVQSEGVGAIASALHPDALAEFRAMILPIFEAEAESGQPNFTNAVFGGPKTIDEIRALDPEAFIGAFMSFLGQQMQNLNVKFDQIDILGSVPEGEVRHVLARVTVGAGEISVTEMEVLSFTPYEDTWRLQLNGELKGIATALRGSIPQ